MSIAKKIIKIVLSVILCLILVVVIYVAYYLLSYKRIEDNLSITPENNRTMKVETKKPYKAVSYNTGFGAYTKDFGFFMDGGTEGRAWSKESVNNTVNGIIALLLKNNADINFLQEVDVKATRSYNVNQLEMYKTAFKEYSSVYAENYNSPYLIYPFHSPLGSAKAGILTLSKFNLTTALRRSLPVESGFGKYMDLDRCYTITTAPVANGKTLYVYNVHLSAYTSDGKIADEQFKNLVADMKSKYDGGDYVICAGDFNKDVLGNSSEVFGVDGEKYTWAQPIKEEFLLNTGLSLKKPFDPKKPVPTCRNADGPYNEKQFVVSIDSFIVSDNVTVSYCNVIDTGFEFSDHNPVEMSFTLD